MFLGTYKDGDEPSKERSLNIQCNQEAVIDPEFSQNCINKLNQNESILDDMIAKYPEIIPIIDLQLCCSFIDYIDREGPDFQQLFQSFLHKNSSIFIQNNVIGCLLNKAPLSFQLIFETIKQNPQEAFNSFDDQCGFFILTKFSFDEDWKLIISKILQLIIDKSSDYSAIFSPPGNPFEEDSGESEIPIDLTYPILIENLLSSGNENAVLSTLQALQIGFSNDKETQATRCCVLLGHLFVDKFFAHLMENPNLQDEAVHTLSIALKHLPLIDAEDIFNIITDLLSFENSEQNKAGIQMCMVMIEYFSKQHDFSDFPGVIPNDAFENLFLKFEILPKLFQFTVDGSYNQKILSFKAIDLFVQFCQPNQLLYLLDNGLFQIFDENFTDEPLDTPPEQEILISTLDLLKHTLQKTETLRLPEECYQQLQVYFKYIEYMILNANDEIADYLKKNKCIEFYIMIHKEQEEESVAEQNCD